MIKFAFYESPVGILKIGYDNENICYLKTAESIDCENEPSELAERAFLQLEEYLRKDRKVFDLPLELSGTAFQMKVWQELLRIPFGRTATYSEIAEKVGNPKSGRAVGMAVHNNPIWIVIPCHRIIGKNGKLTGYAGGMQMKEKLIEIEKQ